AGGARTCVRIPAGRLRYESRARAAAQLASRCARRRSDADLRRAVRFVAQCGSLRGRALQGAGGRLAAIEFAGPDADGLWSALSRAGCLLSMAPAGHQASVRL